MASRRIGAVLAVGVIACFGGCGTLESCEGGPPGGKQRVSGGVRFDTERIGSDFGLAEAGVTAQRDDCVNESVCSVPGLSMSIVRPSARQGTISFIVVLKKNDDANWIFDPLAILHIRCYDAQKKQQAMRDMHVETWALNDTNKIQQSIRFRVRGFDPHFIKVEFGATALESGMIPIASPS